MLEHTSTVPELKKKGCQNIGRSRGGLSTKIHATCDTLGNPTGLFLTSGQAHDLKGFDHLSHKLCASYLLADRAYDAKSRVMEKLKQKNVEPVIPPKQNRKIQRYYDKNIYKKRHLVENLFQKLKQYRAIATRYDKLSQTFMGGLLLASSILWLN